MSNPIKSQSIRESKIKEFYTTKINHEIKNSLISLRSKFEELYQNNNTFFTLVTNKTPKLELGIIIDSINLLINKIFNICDFLSDENIKKIENSKIFIKDFSDSVISMVRTEFDQERNLNKLSIKAVSHTISQDEYVQKDERKLKQLFVNSFNFLKSLNIFGSEVRFTISHSENKINISMKLKGKKTIQENIFKDLSSLINQEIDHDLILKKIENIDFFQNIENYSNYYYLILIKKLALALQIDFKFLREGTEISLLFSFDRDKDCIEEIRKLNDSEPETLKISLRQLCFDKNKISFNKILSKFTKKKSTKLSFKNPKLLKIKKHLKELEPNHLPTKFFINNGEKTESSGNKSGESSDDCDANSFDDEFFTTKIIKRHSSKISNTLISNKNFHSDDNYQNVFKIFIVDDDHSQRSSLKRLIYSFESDCILNVIEAFDGIDALYKIMNEINNNPHSNCIKCIFFDENMKFLNGSKTIEILMKNNTFKEYLKDVYMVSLSSHYSVEFCSYILACGANLCLTKPVERSLMQEILNKVL